MIISAIWSTREYSLWVPPRVVCIHSSSCDYWTMAVSMIFFPNNIQLWIVMLKLHLIKKPGRAHWQIQWVPDDPHRVRKWSHNFTSLLGDHITHLVSQSPQAPRVFPSIFCNLNKMRGSGRVNWGPFTLAWVRVNWDPNKGNGVPFVFCLGLF